jgi:hypothetical protein
MRRVHGEAATDEAQMCDPDFLGRRLVDHQCDDAGFSLVCKCTPETEPVKVQEWSMDSVCPTCFASTAHSAAVTGAMTTEFKIRKNTLTFGLSGEPGADVHVKLTIVNRKAASAAKRLRNMPFVIERPSSDNGDWYPVNWDLSQFIGETAVIEVADADTDAAVKVDEFTFFNDAHACLPGCMDIVPAVLEDGSTSFHFEKDHTPYVLVKATNDNGDGVYCRQGPVAEGGSRIGPGVGTMTLTNDRNGNVAHVNMGNLQATAIPRCLQISLRGSHFAISTAENQLGVDSVPRTFAFAPRANGHISWDDTDDGVQSHREWVDEDGNTDPGWQPGEAIENLFRHNSIHCVYDTLKPRCLDYSKPAVAFKPRKRMMCDSFFAETTCLDQCLSIHCPAEESLEAPCGRSNAFTTCSNCCDNNTNVASGCFRRRRRLRQAAAAVAEGGGMLSYSVNECAGACLDDMSCIGYQHDDGTCLLTSHCDKSVPEGGSMTWVKGTWHVLKFMSDADLTSRPPREPAAGTPKRKKRRRKRADTNSP